MIKTFLTTYYRLQEERKLVANTGRGSANRVYRGCEEIAKLDRLEAKELYRATGRHLKALLVRPKNLTPEKKTDWEQQVFQSVKNVMDLLSQEEDGTIFEKALELAQKSDKHRVSMKKSKRSKEDNSGAEDDLEDEEAPKPTSKKSRKLHVSEEEEEEAEY